MFITFYGDDFTGSTDVLESLSTNGIPAALFLEPPAPEEVENFRLINRCLSTDGHISAFGVPGISRSLSPEEMEEQLPAIFEKISKVPSRFFHYKTCSTFDSSPTIGNIALATDIALRSFPSEFVPLIVAAPALGRYCVFGNLFARVDDKTYRLDRHPTMSRHPVTPMIESDLRRHIATLGPRPVALIELHQLEENKPIDISTLEEVKNDDCPYILIDIADQKDLQKAGAILYDTPQVKGQLLVGSSGVEYAITSYLETRDLLQTDITFPTPGPVEQIIALSGSAAPSSAMQILHAIEIGFTDIRIQTSGLIEKASQQMEIDRVVSLAANAIEAGKSPMIYAAIGPDDPAIAQTKIVAREKNVGPMIAKAQGLILKQLLEKVGPQRVVVAGGDTSGYSAKALCLYALEMSLPIAPGAPLCIAHSREPAFHGLEICLKGGQNGNARFFESILKGEALS